MLEKKTVLKLRGKIKKGEENWYIDFIKTFKSFSCISFQ